MVVKLGNMQKKNKIFRLNNFGNHIRDFTYVEDAVSIVKKLKFSKHHEVYKLKDLHNLIHH